LTEKLINQCMRWKLLKIKNKESLCNCVIISYLDDISHTYVTYFHLQMYKKVIAIWKIARQWK